MKEYEDWAKTVNIKDYEIKYYKGLGTSTNEEAIEYFENINKYKI